MLKASAYLAEILEENRNMLENAKRVGRDTESTVGSIEENGAYRMMTQKGTVETVINDEKEEGGWFETTLDQLNAMPAIGVTIGQGLLKSKLTFEQFELIQVHLFSKCIGLAKNKGKEYANSSNTRLSNFHRLQDRVGINAKAVLWIYLTKHLDSIESYIKTGKTFSSESIESRIVDAITYLTLLHGLIIEESGPAAIGKAILEANEWKASQQKF